MLFVEAFSPHYYHHIPSPSHVNGWNALPSTSPLLHQNPDRAIPLLATTTASEVILSSAVAIDFDEEYRHRIVTVPPFLAAGGEHDDTYPSMLHKIHILPILTDEETSKLLQLARSHAMENRSWEQQDSSRHVSYRTVDFATEESIEISEYLGQSGIQFEERIFGVIREAFDVDVEDLSFLDLFCTSYEAKDTDATKSSDEGRNTMDRLDLHRDGSLFSFTILLSPPEEFDGGGTAFDAFSDVDTDDGSNSVLQPSGVIRPLQAGYATLHSGKLLHGGHVITKGQRIVLVGFVDVHERNIKPGALGDATKEWGRNDVRTFWNQRRLSLSKQQQQRHLGETRGKIEDEQPLWKVNSWRYLPKDTAERRLLSSEGRSYLGKNSTMPTGILKNIEERASLEKIRRRRLMTEDRLLRDILLPRGERVDKIVEDEGELIEVDIDSFNGMMLGWDGDDVEDAEC